MANDIYNWEEDEGGQSGGSGEAGKGGKSGEVGFRFKTEIYRDDQLSPAELQRLIDIHEDLHKGFVDKQKLLRKDRQLIKEGRKSLASQHRAGLGMGGQGRASPYKKHPISNSAQFSGIDKQVIGLPSENEAKTNDELRNDLENRYNYRLQPTRQFNPKPRPY